MSRNNVGDDGARALADMLRVNKSLRTLRLYGNPNMTSESAKYFQASLPHNKTIHSVHLPKETESETKLHDKRLYF